MPRRAVAAVLEGGQFRGVAAHALSRGYAWLARPERALNLPPGARVVGVGGTTLGGSGKTPMVLALARAAASAGADVAVVCSGYPVRTGAPRVTFRDATAAQVGDEAAWLARELGERVAVVVGRDRQRALTLAAARAELILVDGLLQAEPERLALSLLMAEADRPFGAERCPPAGDLRAEPERLLAACDAVLVPCPVRPGPALAPHASTVEQAFGAPAVGRAPRALALEHACRAAQVPLWPYSVELLGARRPDGALVSLSELAQLPLGVAFAIAHPERALGALAEAGVHPRVTCLAADHGRPRPAPAGVAAWLVTAKCSTKLGSHLAGAPVWVLERRVSPPAPLLAQLGISARETAARSVVCSAPCSPRASL